MASQWSRLRYYSFLQRSSLRASTTRLEDATSLLQSVGVLGAAVASAALLVSETSSSDELTTNINPSSANQQPALGENNPPSTIDNNSQPPTSLLAPPLPKLAYPLHTPPLTNCEGYGFKALFTGGRKSSLRRNNTVIAYQKEVSKESLRSRYKVNWKKPLGEGGFGAVYSATDRRTGEKVAVKQISKKYTDSVGFQREMQAFLHLRRAGGHPNICGLRENFDEGNYFYFSLDLISGGEMFDHLIRSGPYSEEDASRLVREVASALSFMHGIGFVHGDLKPENLMLSTENTSDAVIKVIDFGCAQVTASDKEEPGVVGLTAAYSSPEMLRLPPKARKRINPPLDMWALGCIIHIMLVGCHPFDLEGDASDTQIANLVKAHAMPETLQKNSELTSHLSESAIDLIRKLLDWDPKKRITASQMLQHPWVTGETARKDKISGSDEKLSKFRVFKSSLEARVFQDLVAADTEERGSNEVSKRTSLIELSFRKLDEEQKGYVTAKDLKRLTGSVDAGSSVGKENDALSLSEFSSLLSENMKDRYYPRDHLLYKEGEIGNSMLFVNSGKLEVTTKDGYVVEVYPGSFVGEGALISADSRRNATVKCLTPVHAIEVSREYFEKYLKASESLNLHMREKDKKRALNRTKNILRRQRKLKALDLKNGDNVFRVGDSCREAYIVEEGMVDIVRQDHVLATSTAGQMFGVASLITNQNRNSCARCASEKCRVQIMEANEFFSLLDSSPIMKSSVYDVFLRREFAKAVAYRTKKKLPLSRADLRKVFDSIDSKGDGYLTIDEVQSLLEDFDENTAFDIVEGVMNSLDIDSSGFVDFSEFCQVFATKESIGK